MSIPTATTPRLTRCQWRIGAAPTREGFLRLSVIRALLEGYGRSLVCDMFHVPDRRVRLWVHRFNGQGIDCPRCRCELATLARIRLEATSLLRRAKANLRRGLAEAALAGASASWDLHHSRAAASVAFVAATLGCEVADGIAWLRRARRLES